MSISLIECTEDVLRSTDVYEWYRVELGKSTVIRDAYKYRVCDDQAYVQLPYDPVDILLDVNKIPTNNGDVKSVHDRLHYLQTTYPDMFIHIDSMLTNLFNNLLKNRCGSKICIDSLYEDFNGLVDLSVAHGEIKFGLQYLKHYLNNQLMKIRESSEAVKEICNIDDGLYMLPVVHDRIYMYVTDFRYRKVLSSITNFTVFGTTVDKAEPGIESNSNMLALLVKDLLEENLIRDDAELELLVLSYNEDYKLVRYNVSKNLEGSRFYISKRYTY